MSKEISGLKLLMLEFINETGISDYHTNPKGFLESFFNWVTESKSLSENYYNKYGAYNNNFSKKIYLDLMIKLAEINTLSEEEIVNSLDKLLLIDNVRLTKSR